MTVAAGIERLSTASTRRPPKAETARNGPAPPLAPRGEGLGARVVRPVRDERGHAHHLAGAHDARLALAEEVRRRSGLHGDDLLRGVLVRLLALGARQLPQADARPRAVLPAGEDAAERPRRQLLGPAHPEVPVVTLE